MRTGIGYDIHPLRKGKHLVLCGVKIPFHMELEGHSDADVALHAAGDAILGAAGLGDIGVHFPDTDDKYRGISSLVLVEKIRKKLKNKGYEVNNIDITIVCQEPKLFSFMGEMRSNIAAALDIRECDVNVKATTREGLGPEGRGEALSAIAVATIIPAPEA